MKKVIATLLIATVLALVCSGCLKNGNANQIDDTIITKSLESFYPGDIMKVDAIEILDGETGNIVTITDLPQIHEWINKIRKLEITTELNPEDTVGVLFNFKLFEQDEIKCTMSPSYMGGQSIITSEELAQLMTELYKDIIDAK